MNTIFKKSAIVLLAAALIGTAGIPAFAKEKDKENHGIKAGINNIQKGIANNAFKAFGSAVGSMAHISNSAEMPGIGANMFLNSSFKPARTTYNQAVKQAKTVFNTAKKAAHNKFVSAINASNDQTARIAALKTYLTDLLVAVKQRDSAKQAALQQFINAITATPVNQAPTANAQNVNTNKNISKVITLSGSDPEGSALSFFVVTNPLHGTLSGTAPTLTYLPSFDYTGPDSFTFKVNDGSLDSTPASILITVTPSNQ